MLFLQYRLNLNNKYFLLTEFEGHTVSFFPIDLWGNKIEGEKRGSVTYMYSTNQENKVSKMFIISLLFA